MVRTTSFVLALAFGLMTVWFQAHQVITGETVQAEDFFGRLASAGKVHRSNGPALKEDSITAR